MMIQLATTAVDAPATHALLISTQCHENYAWREDGSLDTENPYWKAKGGSEYLVSCRTLDADSTATEVAIIVDRVRERIECDNGGFQESIIGWQIVPVDFDPAAGEDDPYTAKWLRERIERMVA